MGPTALLCECERGESEGFNAASPMGPTALLCECERGESEGVNAWPPHEKRPMILKRHGSSVTFSSGQ